MLRHLYIKNFTLIDEIDVDFNEGFSVVTGETGAGKSIILGALGLILGQRADSKTVRTGKDKCVIEAVFDMTSYSQAELFERHDVDYDPDECVIRREITAATGKSRAFINDTPTQLTALKEIGETLIDIHSQHQNLLLNKEDFQRSVVDIVAQEPKLIDDTRMAYDKYKEAAAILSDFERQSEANKENEEFLRFQYNELSNAQLSPGEQEEIEAKVTSLTHAAEIKNALFTADTLLNNSDTSTLTQLKTVMSQFADIEKVFPEIAELSQRIERDYIDIKDIAEDVGRRLDKLDLNPDDLQRLEDRLSLIYSLQKKYHVDDVAQLIDKQTQMHEQLSNIENSDEELEQLRKTVAESLRNYEQTASRLSQVRAKAARKVEQQMHEQLMPLGIPNVRFSIDISDKPISRDGKDKITFMFSANRSTPLMPIQQVASGGEIARVMLSVKSIISKATKLPTIIFDEIDTGISGKVAEKTAQIMKEMGSSGRQVISITHLPQIAASGSCHYIVVKEETNDGTTTKMQLLSPEQRINEIAQMVSGSAISEAALENAKTLLGYK